MASNVTRDRKILHKVSADLFWTHRIGSYMSDPSDRENRPSLGIYAPEHKDPIVVYASSVGPSERIYVILPNGDSLFYLDPASVADRIARFVNGEPA